MPPSPSPILVTLYTKAGCTLCDEVAATLQALRPTYPHQLQQIDITTDDTLFFRYRYTIPVIQIDTQTLKAPLTAAQLTHALRQAQTNTQEQPHA